MAKEQVEATVDVHEPTGVVEAVMEHDEVESFTLDALDSGDIVIGDTAFERKTPEDFASSMLEEDNRLTDQVERMVEQYDNVYVLVEGTLTDFDYLTHTNVESQSLRGFAASIEARYGVGVKFCDTRPLLVDMAVRLARKHTEDPSRELRVDSSVEKDAPVVMRMVACVDGVGADTAEKVYAQYDSIPMLLDAIGNEELDSVDGVGPKTAENIRDALTI
jgi:ERCC4-type nuclease